MFHLSETDGQRDVGDGLIRSAKLFLGILDPQRENIAVRRRSKTVLKSSLEVPFAQAGNVGQVLQCDLRPRCARM